MTTRYQQVFDYADPFTSDAYANDAGHGWDRLTAIAGEYHRGEITWERAVALCDDNARDLEAARHSQPDRTYVVGLPVVITVTDDGTVSYEVDTAEAGQALRKDWEPDDALDPRLDHVDSDAEMVDADHVARHPR